MSATTADTPQVLLEHHLKALRLPTMLREYDKQARTCAVEKADFPNYLLRLTELELLDRDRRSTERRIRQAKFPAGQPAEPDQNHARAAEWSHLRTDEQAVAKTLPPQYASAFFELVGYPIEGSTAMNEKFLATDLTYIDAHQHDDAASPPTPLAPTPPTTPSKLSPPATPRSRTASGTASCPLPLASATSSRCPAPQPPLTPTSHYRQHGALERALAPPPAPQPPALPSGTQQSPSTPRTSRANPTASHLAGMFSTI